MQLNTDHSKIVHMEYNKTGWVASPIKGVDRFMLERSGDENATRATTIVNYGPDKKFPPHVHTGGEEFLVLNGVFSDEDGNYSEGFYVRNPVGSKHAPWSDEGTKIFVKLGQMHPNDKEYVRIDTQGSDWLNYSTQGYKVIELHRFGAERVRLVTLLKGGQFHEKFLPLGAELFIVQGSASIQEQHLNKNDWWRSPARSELSVHSEAGATFYLKTGHL